MVQKIFLEIFKNKKGLHICNPIANLFSNKRSFLSYKHTILKTLSGFKFFEPGAKVKKKTIPSKFFIIYFYCFSVFNIIMKIFSYLFV